MAANDISTEDSSFLREAVRYLEAPNYLMKVADLVGVPLQKIVEGVVPATVAEIANNALRSAMDLAANSVFASTGNDEFANAYNAAGWTGFWHRLAATATGGISGAIGLPGLAIELPVTTGILFRAIAGIASDFGEDLSDAEVRFQCFSIFAFGGPSRNDDDMDASYITFRLTMAKMIHEAAEFVAGKSAQAVAEAIAQGSAPALINFLSRVAAQFDVTVSQKFLAQSVPVIGIATGAAINNAFAGHFNTVAQYHFGIRKMERRYGQERVHAEYARLLKEIRPKALEETDRK